MQSYVTRWVSSSPILVKHESYTFYVLILVPHKQKIMFLLIKPQTYKQVRVRNKRPNRHTRKLTNTATDALVLLFAMGLLCINGMRHTRSTHIHASFYVHLLFMRANIFSNSNNNLIWWWWYCEMVEKRNVFSSLWEILMVIAFVIW